MSRKEAALSRELGELGAEGVPALGHTPGPQERFLSGLCYSHVLHRTGNRNDSHPPHAP